ncbi:hypothetical protein ACFLU6_08110, partial [Acidobacteriota bacterium]
MCESARHNALKGIVVLVMLMLPLTASAQRTEPLIADHNCIDIDLIPTECIEQAKSMFMIAYGHTSHGSQIPSGMSVLRNLDPLFDFNATGTNGALVLLESPAPFSPALDLGNPNRTEWEAGTRRFLSDPTYDHNMIMWSWCGQASSASETDIDSYLTLMDGLERDYADITFVYMTGHLDGSGVAGNLHLRNEQIRAFCLANNKILFDFADIESYDPDGNYYLDLGADDGCNYSGGNWAEDWCAAHPGECSSVSCAHSRSLNCDMKGRAFWWMMARLAGGDPSGCQAPLERLMLTKGTDDIVMVWDDPNTAVLGYNVWYANLKDEIDLARFVAGSPAVGVGSCTPPDPAFATTCTD